MALLIVLMVPLFDMQAMSALLESFPPVILAMVGVGDDLAVFTSNEGFVALGFFGKSALIFAVYPVVMGMRISANEEDEGTSDVLLSLPISRAQVMVEEVSGIRRERCGRGRPDLSGTLCRRHTGAASNWTWRSWRKSPSISSR